MVAQYNDTITQIAQMSFTFNHIVTFTLVQRTPNMASNQRDLKEKFFFMVTFAPGVNGAANRTYDFKSKITQKFATREIAGLSEILHQCAIGNDFNVLPYAKFSKSANNNKQLAVWVSSKPQQISNETRNVRFINLTVSQDKVKHSIALTPDQAFGMSKVLNTMYEKAIKFEFDNFVVQPFQDNNRFNDEPVNNFQGNNMQGNNGFQPNQGYDPNFNPGNNNYPQNNYPQNNQQQNYPQNNQQQNYSQNNRQNTFSQPPKGQQGSVPFNNHGTNPYSSNR